MSTGFLSSSGEPRFLRLTDKYSINNQPRAKCWGTALTGQTRRPLLSGSLLTHINRSEQAQVGASGMRDSVKNQQGHHLPREESRRASLRRCLFVKPIYGDEIHIPQHSPG